MVTENLDLLKINSSIGNYLELIDSAESQEMIRALFINYCESQFNWEITKPEAKQAIDSELNKGNLLERRPALKKAIIVMYLVSQLQYETLDQFDSLKRVGLEIFDETTLEGIMISLSYIIRDVQAYKSSLVKLFRSLLESQDKESLLEQIKILNLEYFLPDIEEDISQIEDWKFQDNGFIVEELKTIIGYPLHTNDIEKIINEIELATIYSEKGRVKGGRVSPCHREIYDLPLIKTDTKLIEEIINYADNLPENLRWNGMINTIVAYTKIINNKRKSSIAAD